MDCLLAKAIPCITDCVVAELEKLGPKYRVALRLSKDPRFQRLPCSHQGTYADDCLVQVGVLLACHLKYLKYFVFPIVPEDVSSRVRSFLVFSLLRGTACYYGLTRPAGRL